MTTAFVFDDETRIVERYLNGISTAALSREFGCSRTPIERVLRAAGVYDGGRQRVGGRFTHQEQTLMVNQYNAGDSIHKIAKKYGAYPQSIWRILRARGVEFRDNAWRGGRVKIADGRYVAVYRPGHPMAQSAGYVPEHRLVMAESLGRMLTSDETVHHLNGNPEDNRIENLQLRSGQHGRGVRFRCADCGSHNVEPAPL